MLVSDWDRTKVNWNCGHCTKFSFFSLHDRNSNELISMKSCPPTWIRTHAHVVTPIVGNRTSDTERCGGDEKNKFFMFDKLRRGSCINHNLRYSAHFATYVHICFGVANRCQAKLWWFFFCSQFSWMETNEIEWIQCFCVCGELITLHQLISITSAINRPKSYEMTQSCRRVRSSFCHSRVGFWYSKNNQFFFSKHCCRYQRFAMTQSAYDGKR